MAWREGTEVSIGRKRRGKSLFLLFLLSCVFMIAGVYWYGSHWTGNGASPESYGQKEKTQGIPTTTSPYANHQETTEVKGIKITVKDTILAPNSDEPFSLYAILSDGKEEALPVAKVNLELNDPALGSLTEEGVLKISPQAKTGDILTIRAVYGNVVGEAKILIRSSLEETVSVDEKGTAYVTNLDDPVIVVNKERNLPRDYVPKDLVNVDVPFSFSGDSPKKKLRKEAAQALEDLFSAAEKEGIHLVGVSGFRSYEMQSAIYQDKVKRLGLEEANRISAYPGQSEHQTGLAIDLSSKSVGYRLVENFGETKEGKWLYEHAPEYGFIIRYPKEKEAITGYRYEPWHIRYVGVQVAKEIAERGLTLEEFFTAKDFFATEE